MRDNLLNNDQYLFIQAEKRLLHDSLLKLTELNLPADSIRTLQHALAQLDELFLLVIVGEFNAGKSALINALLGTPALKEGVTPTTARVTLVRFGEFPAEQIIDEGFSVYTYPLPLLKHLNIVDSPGTNAIIREHEKLTNDFIPRSDLVLFATSADRPMTESERLFLQKILSWGKKVVFIVNKMDILESHEAVEEVKAFVLENAAKILGSQPELFVISAKMAQKAQLESRPDQKAHLREASGFDVLEAYIQNTLDDKTRLRLKLQSPLGVLENIQHQAMAANLIQSEDLSQDSILAVNLESTISSYEKELKAEVPSRLAEVESVLQRFELRGQEFFDNTFRLANIRTLTNSEKVKAKFEHEVVADVSQEIDEKVHALIDWLVDKDLRTWYQVAGALERRQAASQRELPSAGSVQNSKRAELIASVGQTIKSIVAGYDRQKEAEQVGVMVTDAVSQTALFEVGALGIGALVATIITTRALDLTGIVAAGALAVLGFFVIPYKKSKAKENFKQKMADLRDSLMKTLRSAFNKEFELAVLRLRDNISPYTQYVHAEQKRVEANANTLKDLEIQTTNLKEKISGIV
ncbi:MAG: dynamin family protein [Anaerolineaceae bacterium]|nr:dynamin family protein [Anaerolineaceae bacterium]